jgi:predicted  nucleic acid-binding Zn-ribbon protein
VLTKPPQADRLNEILAQLHPAEPEVAAEPEAVPAETPVAATTEPAEAMMAAGAQLDRGEIADIARATAAELVDAAVGGVRQELTEMGRRIDDLATRLTGVNSGDEQALAQLESTKNDLVFQLESVRQQLEGRLDKLDETQGNELQKIRREALGHAESRVQQRVSELRDSIDALSERETVEVAELNTRLKQIESGVLVKGAIIAVVAAAIAFAAAWLL